MAVGWDSVFWGESSGHLGLQLESTKSLFRFTLVCGEKLDEKPICADGKGVLSMVRRAFQDEIKYNFCWGCGPTNEHGLRVKSYWEDGEAVCTFQPKPYHTAGPKNVVNGGIIATVIDCHCVCTAIAAAYRAENRGMDTDPLIWYATASLQVTYLHPTPIEEPVLLRARIKGQTQKKTIVICSLLSKENECARGEVVAVRVPPSWRDMKVDGRGPDLPVKSSRG